MRGSTSSSTPMTRRIVGFTVAAAMMIVAALTVRHYFGVRFPAALTDAAACQAETFFSCTDSAMAPIAAPLGVPLGVLGFVVGALLLLAAVFPSEPMERTAGDVAWLNAALAVGLVAYSVLGLRSLCLLCTSYSALSLLWVAVARPRSQGGRCGAMGRLPSPLHLAVFGAAVILSGGAARLYGQARAMAQAGGEATTAVRQFFALDTVPEPSAISPYWTIRSTDRFEAAPVRIVEWGDFLCSDCRYFAEELHRLEREFPGRINAAFQFFPLEAKCNDVVAKDKHPGACELAYMAAYRPDEFRSFHDEVFAHMEDARDPRWRAELAARRGLGAAPGDSTARAMVHRLIATGAEYERTSSEYAHGVRSTPTILLNGRMIIGTLPYDQLRAIVQALVGRGAGGSRYLEHWVDGG